MVDSEIVGVWRQHKKAKTLSVEVQLWEPTDHRDELEADARVAAEVRGLPVFLSVS